METREKEPGAKVLWVEDDYFLNAIIARRMASANYTLLLSSKGGEALELAKKEHPEDYPARHFARGYGRHRNIASPQGGSCDQEHSRYHVLESQ